MHLGTPNSTEMFHHESWKPIYFGSQKVEVMRHEKLPVWVFALLSVLASSS